MKFVDYEAFSNFRIYWHMYLKALRMDEYDRRKIPDMTTSVEGMQAIIEQNKWLTRTHTARH